MKYRAAHTEYGKCRLILDKTSYRLRCERKGAFGLWRWEGSALLLGPDRELSSLQYRAYPLADASPGKAGRVLGELLGEERPYRTLIPWFPRRFDPPIVMRVVEWGERLYLVDDMESFCHAAETGDDRRFAAEAFFLRKGHHRRRVARERPAACRYFEEERRELLELLRRSE